MKTQNILALSSILLAAVVCYPAVQKEKTAGVHKLLLISFDGFRWNYDEDVDTPHMDYLVKEGVKAKYITPPFVTMTSPSHFTIVTGRWIEDHGVIHNMMFNTETLRKYGYKQTQNKTEWWDNGVLPLWITAQNQRVGHELAALSWPWRIVTDPTNGYQPTQPLKFPEQLHYFCVANSKDSVNVHLDLDPLNIGKKAASFHYPGGNANYSGQSVTRSLAESSDHPDSNETEWRENIDIVMNWFAKEDFDFVTLYYGEPDNTGHYVGPETEERKKIIQQIDRTLGYLLSAIEKHGLKDILNVIITSDHGMTTVKKAPQVKEILLKDYIKFQDVVKFDIVDYGGFGMILPKPGKEEEIYQLLKKAHPHLRVYKKEEFPEHFHYARHERVLPILLYGDSGYVINGRWIIYVNKGDHGFDNEGMDMKTIFRAFGPDFKKGYLAEAFDSIHIYPLMCKLLGVQPEVNNGSLAVTEEMLRTSASGKFLS